MTGANPTARERIFGFHRAADTAGAQGLHQAVTGRAVLIAGTWAGLAWNTTGTLPLILSGTSAVALAVLMATLGGSWKSVAGAGLRTGSTTVNIDVCRTKVRRLPGRHRVAPRWRVLR